MLREAAKKSSSLIAGPLRPNPPPPARPLRGGGGVKAGPLRIKELDLDILSKYGHIMLKIVGMYFYMVVTLFSKK